MALTDYTAAELASLAPEERAALETAAGDTDGILTELAAGGEGEGEALLPAAATPPLLLHRPQVPKPQQPLRLPLPLLVPKAQPPRRPPRLPLLRQQLLHPLPARRRRPRPTPWCTAPTSATSPRTWTRKSKPSRTPAPRSAKD
jgi:hypothetical protein